MYAENSLLIGESRNLETKLASFFCLEATTGNVLWNNLLLDEPWWIGVEAVEGDIVFFHRYAQPELPEHKSIEAHDCRTGKLLWVNPDLIFWFVLDDKVYANKNFFEKRVTYCLDAATGTVLGECSDVTKEYAEAYKKKQETAVQYPIPMDLIDESDAVSAAVKKRWNDQLVINSLETIQVGEYNVVGFYTSEKTDKDTADHSAHLEIIRSNDQHVAYSKILSEHLAIATPDLFFVVKNILYCIDHQTTILAIPI
jgi:outer membrane protein assembly factor BamB